MSSFIWECIRQEDVDAMDYLCEINEEPVNIVRQKGVDDVSFAHQLRSNLFEVEFRGKNLQQIFESLSNRVDGLSSTRGQMTGKEREAEDDEFERFHEEVRYANTLRLLKVAIRKNERIRTEILKSTPIEAVEKPTRVPLVVAPKPLSHFALPTLQLPVFNGEPTEWSSFWDRFKYAVHEIDDERLPPVIKLSHLLNSVRGPAREVISGLPINDSSYQIAVKLLSDRFGSKDTTIKLLYGRLEMLKCHGKEGGSLLKFSNELEKILLQLEHLGEDVKSYNLYLSIVKKLPYYLLKEIVHDEKTTPRDKQLQMVRDKIRSTIRERDDIDLLVQRSAMPTRQSFNPLSSSNQIRRPQLAIEDRISSLTFATPATRTKSCLLCTSTSHYSPECDKFKSLASRVNKLKQINRCSKCARPGHNSASCRTDLICRRCQAKDHLTMLCPRRFEPSNSTTPSSSANSNHVSFAPPPSNSSFANPRVVEASTNVSHVVSKRSVLLQCVKVDVVNPLNPAKRASVLVMFDNGSTTSYISRSLIDQLKLRRSHSCVLSYGVFGDPSPRNVLSDIVSFAIVGAQNTSIPITAQSVGFLSRAVPHALIDNSDQRQILDANLSVLVEHGSPDILIGMDYYGDFEIRHQMMLASGLSLFTSNVGPLVIGCSNSSLSSACNSVHSVVTLHSTRIIEEKDSIKFNRERYEVRLPGNHISPALPNNFGRLRSLKRKPTDSWKPQQPPIVDRGENTTWRRPADIRHEEAKFGQLSSRFVNLKIKGEAGLGPANNFVEPKAQAESNKENIPSSSNQASAAKSARKGFQDIQVPIAPPRLLVDPGYEISERKMCPSAQRRQRRKAYNQSKPYERKDQI